MLFLITRYVLFVSHIEYLWIFSIYGYSFMIFLFTTVLNIIPINWLRWVFLSLSGFNSFYFITSEMFFLIKSRLDQGWCKFLLIVIYLMLSHAVFVMALKMYFLT
jgi:hypothetical protein